MKTTLLIAAIAAGMTLAAGAQARDGGARFEMPAFEEIDANSDGAVTSEEITAAMQAQALARFEAVDTNGDGALSAEEMIAQAEGQRASRMADRIADRIEKADANGDGVLQAEELRAQMGNRRGANPDRLFNRFDADDNGSLSAQEYAAVLDRMQDRRDHGRRDN